MEDRKYSVMLARFPGGNREMPSSSQWILETNLKLKDDPRVKQPVLNWYKSDTPITMVRNEAVKIALDQNIDYLLMIDSDMFPDYYLDGAPGSTVKPFWDSSWKFMMERRVQEAQAAELIEEHGEEAVEDLFGNLKPATVAAPYCGPTPSENCFVFMWKSHQSDCADPTFFLEMIPRESAAIRSGFEEVPALPTGLILYDMRLFRILPPPWFRYEWTNVYEMEKATTEDVFQTRNAHMLGLPQFVNWDAWAGHCKEKIVGKPTLIYKDFVHESFRQAVLRGIDSNDRLMFIRPRSEPPLPAAANGHALEPSTVHQSPSTLDDGAI